MKHKGFAAGPGEGGPFIPLLADSLLDETDHELDT